MRATQRENVKDNNQSNRLKYGGARESRECEILCQCAFFGIRMAMSRALASDPEGNAKAFPSGPCAYADSVCRKCPL